MTTLETTKPTAGPGLARMKKQLGPKGTESLRQDTVKQQAAAKAKVAPTKTPEAKTTKAKPPKERKADGRKITVLAKENPHATGSKRAKWFGLIKNGMTVDEAVAAGVRSVYLARMAARKIVKLA